MKDTKKRNKVATTAEGKPTVFSKTPGERNYPFQVDDMTETEWAIVAALREARHCESSWDAYYKQDAWYFVRSMTQGVIKGESIEQLQGICDPDQFHYLYAAAVANAFAITALVAGWKKETLPKGAK